MLHFLFSLFSFTLRSRFQQPPTVYEKS